MSTVEENPRPIGLSRTASIPELKELEARYRQEKFKGHFRRHPWLLSWYLIFTILSMMCTSGCVYGWTALNNAIGKTDLIRSASQLSAWSITAFSINSLGSTTNGFINDILGLRWAHAFSAFGAGVGYSLMTAAFYRGNLDGMFGAGLCISSFFGAGTCICLGPLSYLYGSPTFIFAIVAALYSSSAFSYSIINAIVHNTESLKVCFLIFTLFTYAMAIVGLTLPKDFIALKRKWDSEAGLPVQVHEEDLSIKETLKIAGKALLTLKWWWFAISVSCIQAALSLYEDNFGGIGAYLLAKNGYNGQQLLNINSNYNTIYGFASGFVGFAVAPFAGLIADRVGISLYEGICLICYPWWAFFLLSEGLWSVMVTCWLQFLCSCIHFSGMYAYVGQNWDGRAYGILIGILCVFLFVASELLECVPSYGYLGFQTADKTGFPIINTESLALQQKGYYYIRDFCLPLSFIPVCYGIYLVFEFFIKKRKTSTALE